MLTAAWCTSKALKRGSVSYGKTILLAFAICFATLGVASLTLSLLLVSHNSATGIAFSLRGLAELLATSLALGWIAGTIWYFARR
jgi:hypothetical protein